MCDVWLDWSELEHAWDVALRRVVRKLRENSRPRYGADHSNLGRRLAKDLDGCAAELAVAKHTGLVWHGPEEYHPGAPDVGTDVEVRFSDTGLLLTHPADHDERRYYLVTRTLDPRCWRVVGWLYGADTKQHWRPDMPHPCYATSPEALNRV